MSTWHLDRNELLHEYLNVNADKNRYDYGSQAFYPESETDIYPVVALDEDVQPLTTVGADLASMGVDVAQSMYQLRQRVAKMLQVFIVVGLIAIVGPWRSRSILPIEYQLMSVGGVLILGLGLVLPVLSVEYGLLRLFQQMLAVLAVPAVLGCVWALSVFGQRVAYALTTAVSVFIFLLLSGFLPQAVGGYAPQFNLSNSGVYYDAHYTHSAEVAAMRWLADNRREEESIHANMFAAAKMLTYARLEAFIGIAPRLLNRHSYVYLDRYNTERQADIAYYNGDMIRYSYPTDFLLDKKDLIYSNGQSTIFK